LPSDSLDRPRYLSQLGGLLARRYEMTGRPVDLDVALVALRAAVDDTPVGSPARPAYLCFFGKVLLRRYQTAGRSDDLDAAIVALRAGVDGILARSRERG